MSELRNRIENLEESIYSFMKGGPGSGQKGHRTVARDSKGDINHFDMVKTLKNLMEDKEQTKTWSTETWGKMGALLDLHSEFAKQEQEKRKAKYDFENRPKK